ncbi:MAG: hypothetical protein DWG81_01365 [Chloroflexi bacterium]|nr:hypothetical protein [Chloroflexota bacterium]
MLRGVALIRGTADHPAFDHYEVSFAYEPNPTASWFAIEAAGGAAVPGGQLASWDTTQIADGAYQLRLQVFVTTGEAPLEFITTGLSVANSVPLPTASTTPQATAVAIATASVATVPVSTPPSAASDLPTSTPAVSPSGMPAISPSSSPEATPAIAPAGDVLLPAASPYVLALGRGALAAIAGFLSLGMYALLRPFVRPAWRRFKRNVSADLRRP